MSGNDRTIRGIVPGFAPLHGNSTVKTSQGLSQEHTGRVSTGIIERGRSW